MTDRSPPDADLKFDDVTREDLKKIEKSMKRPEFMGLLNEYMIEISDPKNKNEYDEYLKQMERQRELPKHMKIVELKPHFCFRTFIFSAKNKKHEMKFFINMCSSEYMQKPVCEPSPDKDGKVGYSWKIPNSIGKIRYDQDRHGSPCQVVDIAFHPDNYGFARRKQFKEMMINIALEASERLLGERKQTLSRDYVILQKVICKGQDGKPALLPIRLIQGKMYNKGEGPNAETQRDNEGRQTKLQRDINKQKQQFQTQKGKKAPKDEEEKEEQIQEQKQKLIVDLDVGVQRPKYSTIYTYPIDYGQFIESDSLKKKKKIPSVFNVEFSVPRVQSMEEIAGQKLEINDKKILLQIGDKYFIDLQLQDLKVKYVLLTANAKAKFDKKKKSLRIVIPIDQNQKYQQEPQPESSLVAPTGNEQNQKQQILQNQTWKNKVLEIPQSAISVHFLDNESKKEQTAALIQEIDDQDQIDEKKVIPKIQVEEKIIEEQDENAEPYEQKREKFKLSKYYKKEEGNKNEGVYHKLSYLFQETAEKVLLVFQMKNYKKDDLTMIHQNNREFLIQWAQPSSKEGNKVIKYSHLKLSADLIEKVNRIELLQRVGFAAFVIFKESSSSQYWQKSSVSEVIYEQNGQGQKYTFFKENLTQIQQRQIQKVQIKQQQLAIALALQQQKKVDQNPKQIRDPSQIVEKQQPAVQAPKSQKYNLQQIFTGQRQVDPKKQPQFGLPKQNIFSNMQAQFIYFSAPFIQVLD